MTNKLRLSVFVESLSNILLKLRAYAKGFKLNSEEELDSLLKTSPRITGIPAFKRCWNDILLGQANENRFVVLKA
jgi:hypothetical protein